MRIALVTETLFSPGSSTTDGVTTTVKAVADRMIDLGHEVGFIAAGPGLALYRRSRVARVSPISKTGRQVRAALDDLGPDAVVSVDPRRLGRRALAHAHGWGIPTLVVQQSVVDPKDALLWPDRVAGHTDEVVATSRWLQSHLADVGVDADLWLPGVDTAAFSPALRDPWLHGHWSRAKSRPEPLTVVGYAGRLAKPQGVRRLAELGGIPNIRLVVAGDGPQRSWLEQRLTRAKFVGALSTGDLAVALASLDVLVHPGEQEGCGHLLREAAAGGVPIVAARAGAAPEIVHHLETGLLYDSGRDRDFADAVTAVAADPQRALLGGRGRDLAGERTWTTAADELLARLQARTAVGIPA